MIRQQYQKFTDLATPSKGDCFATCVAMVLDLPRDDVPDFPAGNDDPAWWSEFQSWLDKRGLTAIEVVCPPAVSGDLARVPMVGVTDGTPCILSGPSPRGSWKHAVVGIAEANTFVCHLDPHPDGGFISVIERVLFFALIRPDRARKLA